MKFVKCTNTGCKYPLAKHIRERDFKNSSHFIRNCSHVPCDCEKCLNYVEKEKKKRLSDAEYQRRYREKQANLNKQFTEFKKKTRQTKPRRQLTENEQEFYD